MGIIQQQQIVFFPQFQIIFNFEILFYNEFEFIFVYLDFLFKSIDEQKHKKTMIFGQVKMILTYMNV